MRLSRIDLNLLVVFDAIFRHRSVTKAAEQLNLSQPAVSHALQRLRWLLKDKLLIRSPNGMQPTPRAEALAERVHRALAEVQLALEPQSFVPEREERRFSIAVNNYAAVVLAGPVIAKCAIAAPRVRLALRPSGTLDLPAMLERNDLDLAIAGMDAPGERFASQLLIEDNYVAVMRHGHPAARKPLSAKAIAAAPHLVISSSGNDLSFVRRALAAANQTLEVALEAPYLSAGTILTQSNAIAILGRLIAQEFRRSFEIEIKDLPFKTPGLRSVMLWHRRFDDLPAHRWLRETIRSAAGAV